MYVQHLATTPWCIHPGGIEEANHHTQYTQIRCQMKQRLQLYNQTLSNQTNILVHLLSMCNNPTIKIITTAWHNRATSSIHNSLLIALEASHTWFGTHTNPQYCHAQIVKVECNYIRPNRGITPPPTSLHIHKRLVVHKYQTGKTPPI